MGVSPRYRSQHNRRGRDGVPDFLRPAAGYRIDPVVPGNLASPGFASDAISAQRRWRTQYDRIWVIISAILAIAAIAGMILKMAVG